MKSWWGFMVHTFLLRPFLPARAPTFSPSSPVAPASIDGAETT